MRIKDHRFLSVPIIWVSDWYIIRHASFPLRTKNRLLQYEFRKLLHVANAPVIKFYFKETIYFLHRKRFLHIKSNNLLRYRRMLWRFNQQMPLKSNLFQRSRFLHLSVLIWVLWRWYLLYRYNVTYRQI